MRGILGQIISAPRDARGLSLFRLFFCSGLALFHGRDFVAYQEIVAQWHPYFTWPYRSWPQLAHIYLRCSSILGGLFILFLVGAALGIRTRTSLALSTVLYFLYQAPIQTYLFYHDQLTLFWMLAVLCFAPEIDYWSVDRGWKAGPKVVSGWSDFLYRVLFVAMFFGAGWSKLQDAGLRWMDGQTLQYWLVRYHLWWKADWGLPLANSLGLCLVASTLVFCFELASPLILFKPRLFPYFVGGTLVFVTGVYLLIRVSFFNWFVLAYLAFIPWSRWLKPKLEPTEVSTPRWAYGLILLIALCQLGGILTRVHAFPFSDYEVFSDHYTLKHFSPVYRLAIPQSDGRYHYLRDTDWYEVSFAMEGDAMRGRGRGEAFLKAHLKQLGISKASLLRSHVRLDEKGKIVIRDEFVKEIES